MVKKTLSRLVFGSLILGSCFGGSFFGAFYGSGIHDAKATPVADSLTPQSEHVVQHSTRCYWPTDEEVNRLTAKDEAADMIPRIVIPTPEELGINPQPNGK